MRWVVIFFGLLFAMVGGYAVSVYLNNPVACVRLGRDVANLFELVRSDVGGSAPVEVGSPNQAPGMATRAAPGASTNPPRVVAESPPPSGNTNQASVPLPASTTTNAPSAVVATAMPAATTKAVPVAVDSAPATNAPSAVVVTAMPAATTNAVPVAADSAPTTNAASAVVVTAMPGATTKAVPAAVDSAPATVAAAPAPAAVKPWAPPEVMPAEPNWDWRPADGKVYEDVVVTKIEPEMVTIEHSAGVAHLEIASLPPEIQKRLNYDPEAAKAAKAEAAREEAHPYYRVAELGEAQKAARELRRPLAWMDAWLQDYSAPNPPLNSEEELAHMAVEHLKSRAILIFVDGNDELGALSPVVREQQLFQFDDGPVPGGHHFYGPKIVFTDAEVTKPLGRVTSTEMMATREVAIDAVVDAIAQGTPAPVPVPPTVPRAE